MFKIMIKKGTCKVDETYMFEGVLSEKVFDKGYIEKVLATDENIDGVIETDSWEVAPNTPVLFYDESWKMKSHQQLVDEGLVRPKNGFKFTGAIFEEKEQLEKWLDGDEELPNTMKFNGDKTNVEAKTQKELFSDGVITEEEYADCIRAERNIKISQIESSDDYKKAQRLALLGDTSAISKLEKFEEQIQTLREIPQQKGFPQSFAGFE